MPLALVLQKIKTIIWFSGSVPFCVPDEYECYPRNESAHYIRYVRFYFLNEIEAQWSCFRDFSGKHIFMLILITKLQKLY